MNNNKVSFQDENRKSRTENPGLLKKEKKVQGVFRMYGSVVFGQTKHLCGLIIFAVVTVVYSDVNS